MEFSFRVTISLYISFSYTRALASGFSQVVFSFVVDSGNEVSFVFCFDL